jgi:hypothetical protein
MHNSVNLEKYFLKASHYRNWNIQVWKKNVSICIITQTSISQFLNSLILKKYQTLTCDK